MHLSRLRPRTERGRATLTAALVGAVGFAVGVNGAGGPSPWLDEAATASMIDRPVHSLAAAVLHQDAVHALYYLILRQWVAVFGSDIAALRIPSAIGLAAGAIAIWAIARRLRWGTGAVLAPAIYLTVPIITWSAVEARSYSWDATAAIVLTLVLLRTLGAPSSSWVLYVAVAVAATYLFLWAVLVVIAHALAVLLAVRSRSTRYGFLGAAAVVAVMTAPLALIALQQQGQVSWIPEFGIRTAGTVGVQWADRSILYAVPALILAALGCVVLIRLIIRRGDGDVTAERNGVVAAVLLSWLVVPTALLLLATAAGKPLYVNRYTIVSAPALAFVIAAGLRRSSRAGVAPIVVAVLAALSLPTYLGQRAPLGKGEDWTIVAAQIATMRAPGTGVYFPVSAHYPRMMTYVYRRDFAGLDDLALQHRAPQVDALWDSVAPVSTAANRARGLTRVLVVGSPGAPLDRAIEAFEAEGFRRRRSVAEPVTTIVELVEIAGRAA